MGRLENRENTGERRAGLFLHASHGETRWGRRVCAALPWVQPPTCLNSTAPQKDASPASHWPWQQPREGPRKQGWWQHACSQASEERGLSCAVTDLPASRSGCADPSPAWLSSVPCDRTPTSSAVIDGLWINCKRRLWRGEDSPPTASEVRLRSGSEKPGSVDFLWDGVAFPKRASPHLDPACPLPNFSAHSWRPDGALWRASPTAQGPLPVPGAPLLPAAGGTRVPLPAGAQPPAASLEPQRSLMKVCLKRPKGLSFFWQMNLRNRRSMVLKGDGGGEQKGGAWVWASAPWDGPLPRPAASPPPSLTLCPPHPSVSPAILPSYPLLCSPLVCWVRGDGEEQRGRPQESGDRDSRPPAGTPGRPDPALRPLRPRSWRSEARQRLCGREAPLPSSESHSKTPSGRPRKVWVPVWDISSG